MSLFFQDFFSLCFITSPPPCYTLSCDRPLFGFIVVSLPCLWLSNQFLSEFRLFFSRLRCTDTVQNCPMSKCLCWLIIFIIVNLLKAAAYSQIQLSWKSLAPFNQFLKAQQMFRFPKAVIRHFIYCSFTSKPKIHIYRDF